MGDVKRCPACTAPWLTNLSEFECGSYFDGADASWPLVQGGVCQSRVEVQADRDGRLHGKKPSMADLSPDERRSLIAVCAFEAGVEDERARTRRIIEEADCCVYDDRVCEVHSLTPCNGCAGKLGILTALEGNDA